MKNLSILLSLAVLINACSQESDLKINLQQSEIFLEENLLNSSVIEIEPGLQYMVLESSQSNLPKPELQIR